MTDVTVELFYDSDWHEIPVYSRDPVVVTVGRTGESKQTPPMSASFTIDNRTGLYNPRNPNSPLWATAGRYTPVRITIDSSVYELEMAKWAPDRSIEPVSGTRGDAWIKATASGIRRRLGQGSPPSRPAFTRAVLAAGPSAYWPMDDGADATVATSGLSGGDPMTSTEGTVLFQAVTSPVGLAGSVQLSQEITSDAQSGTGPVGALTGPVTPVASPTDWTVEFNILWHALAPSGDRKNVVWKTPGGTYAEWAFGSTQATLADPAFPWLSAYNDAGALRVDFPFDSGDYEFDIEAETWVHVAIVAEQVGADAQVTVWFNGVAFDGGFSNTVPLTSHTLAGISLATATAGADPATSGFQFDYAPAVCGLAIYQSNTIDIADHADAAGGYVGESSEERFERVCDQEGVTNNTVTSATNSQRLGPQYPATFLDLLAEIETTDLALIVDSLTGRGLTMYAGGAFFNADVALTIDYSNQELAPPTNPVLDDANVRNDITVERRNGGFARSVQETGPNNVQDPADDPQGVGRVTDRVTVNAQTDEQLPDLASQRRNIGTVDDMRWPSVTVDYVATPGLDVAGVGDRIQVTNLPDELTPDDADLLVVGYTDTATAKTRRITYATVPFSPYRVFEIEAGVENASRIAAGEGETTVNADQGSGSGSFGVTSTAVRWIDSTNYASQFPIPIVINGEVMSCTAISGTTLSQTFTVTRGVNGIQKAIPAGSAIQVLHPAVIAL